MKKLPLPKSITLLLIVTPFAISCVDKKGENNNTLFKTEAAKSDSSIDFNLIDCLNESNKKTIVLTDITFRKTKDVNTLKSLLEIKKDHLEIDDELKKLTEKNMILIPKSVYEVNISSDSLKGKNSSVYLLKTLENEIKVEIEVFDQITKTSKNTDFILFAKKYMTTLRNNNNELRSMTMN